MNKKTIITILLLILTLRVSAQIKAEVSETVELMSILSRTAGFQEFSDNLAGPYTKDTESWFAKYSEHPTVAYFTFVTSLPLHEFNHSFVNPLLDKAESRTTTLSEGWRCGMATW